MNRNVKEAIADVARQTWEQYQLGNKSDARTIFRKLPAERRPLATLYLSELALAENKTEDLYTFIESVTE